MITPESVSVKLADVMRRPDKETGEFDDMALDLVMTGFLFEDGFQGIGERIFSRRFKRQMRMLSDEGFDIYKQIMRGVGEVVVPDLMGSLNRRNDSPIIHFPSKRGMKNHLLIVFIL